MERCFEIPLRSWRLCVKRQPAPWFTQRRKERKEKRNKRPFDDMTENEIAHIVVDKCFRIHSELGPGLFENCL